MFKKSVLLISFLICCFLLYYYFYPRSLEQQFEQSIERQCKKQKECIIHLHEITSFQWDKAYFFGRNVANSYVQKITGIKGNFGCSMCTLIVFTKNSKLVKYAKIPLIDGYYEPFFPPLRVIKTFDVGFSINKSNLLQTIGYYKITLNNDKLKAGCDLEKYNNISIRRCSFYFTNLDQLYLIN